MRKYSVNHSRPNPIIEQEEKAILLAVDRALSSSSNSQTIGRNGEIPLLDFLNRYLPSTLKATSGQFVTPNKNMSPQLDIMILDSRYPLLSQNLDNSVLAMSHSVVQIIEVKTNLISQDVEKIWQDSRTITGLLLEVPAFGAYDSFTSVSITAIAYRCARRLDTIANAYKEFSEPHKVRKVFFETFI